MAGFATGAACRTQVSLGLKVSTYKKPPDGRFFYAEHFKVGERLLRLHLVSAGASPNEVDIGITV